MAFGLGVLSGHFLWWTPPVPTAPVVSAIETFQPESQVEGPIAIKQSEPAYQRLLRAADAMSKAGDNAGAIELIIEADLIAEGRVAVQRVSSQLDTTIESFVRALRENGQSSGIDELYQRLTLTMPERGIFYLKLAEHRVAQGNAERALGVLAQIENHRLYGQRARELIIEITREGKIPTDLAVLPLTRAGDQFLIRAILDGDQALTLLIDTGASITVISPAILTRVGYGFDRGTANFSTANGVVEAPLVLINKLSLGDVVLEDLMVGAIPLDASGHSFDGLLGMNFLREFEFSLDQDSAVLRLQSRRSR
ncbi:MAG: clan AA aspartic protease (TIGR02281 family) [Candidatus Azotimanducaceae bacterium]|jgi:clan AA aspartic protease (TIGR02281 family)